MTALALSILSSTFGFAAGRISWPYGLMYHIRSMRDGRSEVCVLAKVMYCFRSVGREPGRLASSIWSCSFSSFERVRAWTVAGLRVSSSFSSRSDRDKEVVIGGGADGAEG